MPPPRAFDLFTKRMEDWWPKGRTIGKNPHVTIIVEPREGGQWLERDVDGAETPWGKVLAWEPRTRLLLAKQINTAWAFDDSLITEVELTFAPAANGGTIVTLEHRNLERFGADAERQAGLLGNGWPGYLAAFAAFADVDS